MYELILWAPHLYELEKGFENVGLLFDRLEEIQNVFSLIWLKNYNKRNQDL